MTLRPTIRAGRLCFISPGGSVLYLGIRATRESIRQIEASQLPLRPSTLERLAVFKSGVALWESRR